MIIPIRCCTCGHVLADKWEYYKKKCEELDQKVKEEKVKEEKEGEKKEKESKYFTEPFRKEILDNLGLYRYCCRRHMLGHVDIIDFL